MKFARVHKRVREKNIKRRAISEEPIISYEDIEIAVALYKIKEDIDKKVYDRNDILKKDAYFEQTVMHELTASMKELDIKGKRDDRVFLQKCISSQYLNQYNNTYITVY